MLSNNLFALAREVSNLENKLAIITLKIGELSAIQDQIDDGLVPVQNLRSKIDELINFVVS
jgi:hypothetical protein